jgi:D-arabinose 1-dehydrogenase-like Zn-dependent alcohol dehydrogenase
VKRRKNDAFSSSFPNEPFEIVERDIPQRSAAQVRIKVQACGICHSDSMMKEGLFPGIQYPRVPGHEIAGIIYEVGKEETIYKKRFSSDIFDTYSMNLLVFSHLF